MKEEKIINLMWYIFYTISFISGYLLVYYL